MTHDLPIKPQDTTPKTTVKTKDPYLKDPNDDTDDQRFNAKDPTQSPLITPRHWSQRRLLVGCRRVLAYLGLATLVVIGLSVCAWMLELWSEL